MGKKTVTPAGIRGLAARLIVRLQTRSHGRQAPIEEHPGGGTEGNEPPAAPLTPIGSQTAPPAAQAGSNAVC